VGVKGKGEGGKEGGRGLEVGEGMRMVGVVEGMGSGVGNWVQEASIDRSRKAARARFITISMSLRGDCFVGLGPPRNDMFKFRSLRART
jgi:hypothetical protein